MALNPVKDGKTLVPRKAYRGEVYQGSKFLGMVWLVDGQAIVGTPDGRSPKNGMVRLESRLPGTFNPNGFEKSGSLGVSASQSVTKWKFSGGKV